LAPFSLCIVLTLSRTSMIAMAVAATWFVVGDGYRRPWGWASRQVSAISDRSVGRYKNWGPFVSAKGVTSRERIDAASQQLVNQPNHRRGPALHRLK
jgi:hypothetical protein